MYDRMSRSFHLRPSAPAPGSLSCRRGMPFISPAAVSWRSTGKRRRPPGSSRYRGIARAPRGPTPPPDAAATNGLRVRLDATPAQEQRRGVLAGRSPPRSATQRRAGDGDVRGRGHRRVHAPPPPVAVSRLCYAVALPPLLRSRVESRPGRMPPQPSSGTGRTTSPSLAREQGTGRSSRAPAPAWRREGRGGRHDRGGRGWSRGGSRAQLHGRRVAMADGGPALARI
jgi:hypothetical protein